MPSSFTYRFDTPAYKGTTTINTGLFINNEWVDPVDSGTIDVVNPVTGKVITKVAAGSSADIDRAVVAARKTFKTTWGLNCPAAVRGKLLNNLGDLLEKNINELAAIESLDNGKTFNASLGDMKDSINYIRFYAGLAGKNTGKTIETNPAKFAYTREEPIGVCGQIIPWNFPLMTAMVKIGPALAAGCTTVLKPSENTPLSILRTCELIKEAGIPPGVVNVINGYGSVAGQAIAEHYGIDKIAFTGSTLVGRKIVKAAAETNLKVVTLELGGKSPNIILDDADLDQAIKWAAAGIFGNAGQVCCAGSRIFVQEGIYDKFLERMTAIAQGRKLGDSFSPEIAQGPQVSRVQLDRVLGYIDAGKKEGATIHTGGERHGTEGFFVKPTIFTGVKADMKIAREEIFGPVAVVFKFKTDEEVIELANDTTYGLAAAIFSQNITRTLKIANSLEAGSVWVNMYNSTEAAIPFGGYKQSGWGREFNEQAMTQYTQTKAVHVNLGYNL